METKALSEAMVVAASEKAIWLRGRKAFRLHGLGAPNPYPSDDDPSKELWEDGFNYEREWAAERQPRF
ncbi:hypothetical protein [Jiella avicenniae]|uniref:Uncharacterized protein n=1 Tax=Jiella avicenniae TaxID=2907202 RepID=A0A9X1T4T6_9HYPH|nr:hypothetical protein [Jiella avicenniae]MCE7028134.1 hypothetical protein [Jiella avicenniae]